MEYLRTTLQFLIETENYKLARELLDYSEKYIPKHIEGLDLLCHGNFMAKRYLKAIEFGEMALNLTIDPRLEEPIRFNLAKCYTSANYPEKAYKALEENLKLQPDNIDYLLDFSGALYAMNKKEKSKRIIDSLIKVSLLSERDKIAVRFNQGIHELRAGNLQKGLECLMSGRQLKSWGSPTHNYPIPEWKKGMDISGKKILVVGEGGIGDEIINCRFGQHIKKLGGIPTWASAHNLKDVLKQTGFIFDCLNYENFTTNIDNIINYDYWVPCMDLPYVLGIQSFSDLWTGKYLNTLPEYNNKWKQKIQSNKIKVGIRWSGNALYEHNLHRTIPLDKLQAIFNPEKYELYSLQKDDGLEELKNYSHIQDLSNELLNWNDAMSAMEQMDIIVTSCTSIAHVAGALDLKTIVLVPITEYHIWCEENTSSWYSKNVRVVKQTEVRSWDEPINQVKMLLEQG